MKISTESGTFYKITENSPILFLQEILITSDVYKFGKHQYFKICIDVYSDYKKLTTEVENLDKKINNLHKKIEKRLKVILEQQGEEE